MGRIPEAIADLLVAEIKSRTEWDEPPQLSTLYAGAGQPRLAKIPLPDEAWAAAGPAEVLTAVADAVTKGAPILQTVVPAGLYGVAFRCEAWQLTGVPGTEHARQAMRDARAHRLKTRPDRIEIRSIFAVDRAGVNYVAVQERGRDDVLRDIRYPKPGQEPSGAIPDALDRLVAAFLGVSLPGRREIDLDA